MTNPINNRSQSAPAIDIRLTDPVRISDSDSALIMRAQDPDQDVQIRVEAADPELEKHIALAIKSALLGEADDVPNERMERMERALRAFLDAATTRAAASYTDLGHARALGREALATEDTDERDGQPYGGLTLGARVHAGDGDEADTGKVVARNPDGTVTVHWDGAGARYVEDPKDLKRGR